MNVQPFLVGRSSSAANVGSCQMGTTVQQFALFSGIPLPDCNRIVASAQTRQYGGRQNLYCEGDSILHVLLLLSGSVKISQFGEGGQEVILRLAGPGEMVGTGGSIGAHSSTARTVEPSSALVWQAPHFEAACDCFPVLRRNMARVLEKRLNDMDVRFREVSTEKVSPRLSSQLLRLLNQVGKRGNGHVKISLSRRELAQLTGTTLFTVSRLLCQWETRGIVSAGREAVFVRDVPALVGLSQEG